jgi:hypothetical protein
MVDDWQLHNDDESDRLPDPPLTQGQRAEADQLSFAELHEIDTAILNNVRTDFPRKVWMVVRLSMNCFREKHPNLPDVFYAERVKELARDGIFEAFGDLNRMRYSEICLKSKEK